ncbi:hypothetical protein ACFQ4L_06695 [Lapidilactobacillus mulanensis]|uniref:Uncharacterized protein n=1 Tax=Lapidilactobacillus mulanensis TaxID=2485999 RepID=A0ABW4DRG6_9LACO|nr:hypothetical protein [Lapidilactobacillus mulanensis]
MRDLVTQRKFMNLVIWVVLAGMAFFGNLPIFILVYAFLAVLMILRTLLGRALKRTKATTIIVYLLIMVLQFSFSSAVIFRHHIYFGAGFLSRVLGALLVLTPLLAERMLIIHQDTDFYLPSIREAATLSFSEFNSQKEGVIHYIHELGKVKKAIAVDRLMPLFTDLKRHSSMRYINGGSLTESYFDSVVATMTDPYIYLVISNTGSNASELISLFTQKQYNHASLSFDRDLQTIISYNGGENVYPPGLNPEMVTAFHQKSDASVLVYRLPTTLAQKQQIADKIREINQTGSAYNIIGLVVKHSLRPNIMFCSQFVYQMLRISGLTYFTKADGNVKPTDFIELDYYKKLDFCYEIKF